MLFLPPIGWFLLLSVRLVKADFPVGRFEIATNGSEKELLVHTFVLPRILWNWSFFLSFFLGLSDLFRAMFWLIVLPMMVLWGVGCAFLICGWMQYWFECRKSLNLGQPLPRTTRYSELILKRTMLLLPSYSQFKSNPRNLLEIRHDHPHIDPTLILI